MFFASMDIKEYRTLKSGKQYEQYIKRRLSNLRAIEHVIDGCQQCICDVITAHGFGTNQLVTTQLLQDVGDYLTRVIEAC